MYIQSSEGLGQPQKTNDLQEFLDKVRKNPQEYKNFLLEVRLHPFPLVSEPFSTFRVTTTTTGPKTLVDVTLMNGSTNEKVLQELIRISDANLGPEITAERKLRAKMIEALAQLNRFNPSKVEPFLLEAALLDPKKVYMPGGDLDYVFHVFPAMGFNFALQLLGPLGKEILESEAANAHRSKLGYVLADMAFKKTKERAFEEKVKGERQRREQERKTKQQQAEQERKRQQQRRGRGRK